MTIFSANKIKFDKNYLDELTSQPESGVFIQQCKYHLALHPAQLNDFGQSIKDELGLKMARYDESFKGIMLGYTDIKLQSELGVIGPDNCYIHLDIQANFFVFRPEIGMILKGTVTRTTKDHVGCLVYNTFNISLPKPIEDDENWLGNNATVSSEVEFKITYVDLTPRIPHIRGDLRSILSENNISPTKSKKNQKKIFNNSTKIEETEASQELAESFTIKSKKIKKKKKSLSTVDDESSLHTSIDLEDLKEDPITPVKPKKKHKEKHTEEQNEVSNMDIEETFETPKKKKKKSKKEKQLKLDNEDPNASLESLDLNTLFSNTSLDFDKSAHELQASADSSDKRVKRKRSKSISQSQEIYLDKVKLEQDSDLENILSGKPSGKQRRHSINIS